MPSSAASLRTACTTLAAIGLAAHAFAQTDGPRRLYKYTDENGVPVYTDRRPDASQDFESAPLATRAEPARVRLYQRVGDDQRIELVVRNDYFAPIELAFELVAMQNLAAGTPESAALVVPPRTELAILTMRRADETQPMQLEYAFRYVPGNPSARHEPAMPYRLPYALAQGFPVSQAYPDAITHAGPASRHAVDFAMPVGTPVYAARAGTVIDVAADFFEAGTDARAASRANIVRVLHADGTMALYAHLNWNSIRVVPGQQVARGEYLADSGNTGLTTGPHLHFAVQRNGGGGLESVPVRFAGAGGRAVSVARGDEPVAY